MYNKNVQAIISEIFSEIGDSIQNGSLRKKIRIGLTIHGSEHGMKEMIKAAELAKRKYDDFEIVLIGPKADMDIEIVETADSDEGHRVMIKMLDDGTIDGCVTQHFDFPVGVSTVGKIVTPAKGKEIIIATTTGTSSTNRVEAMVLNTISGIAVAKAIGIENPSIGILNVDGAKAVERILKELNSNGFNIKLARSLRGEGGGIMRGNDILAGTPDVMVCDSLTGNLLIKIFSSFFSGGSYETTGAGYGPGVGRDYNRIINIVSRASGAPLICEALRYCADCVNNGLASLANSEFKRADTAGLKEIISGNIKEIPKSMDREISMPGRKVVTSPIQGIDILELESACRALWKEGIYSESGMGCTGPVILVNEKESGNALTVLKSLGYLS